MPDRSIELISVAAVAENGVIGADGDIPWGSIPEDREQYRARTADDPVILGRRTFEMYEDLPGSAQIVLSRSEREFEAVTAHHAGGVDETVEILESLGTDRAYVIGGAGIYDMFQPYVHRMVLSRIPGTYDGDAYFPEWDTDDWTVVDRTSYDEFILEEWVRERS